MAKLSAINKNNKRIKLANKFFKKRQNLKKIILIKSLTLEWFLIKEFLIRANISPSGSLKLIYSFLPTWFNHSWYFAF